MKTWKTTLYKDIKRTSRRAFATLEIGNGKVKINDFPKRKFNLIVSQSMGSQMLHTCETYLWDKEDKVFFRVMTKKGEYIL